MRPTGTKAPAKDTPADSGQPASDSGRTKRQGRAGHFLTPADREVLRRGPTYVQKTRRQYDSRRIDRERRDYASAYARSKRRATVGACAALEDLAFLAATMDADWLYEVATHLEPPRGVPVEVARAFNMDAALPRILAALAERVGSERAPQVRPMTDPDPDAAKWPPGYKQGGTVVLDRTGPHLVSVWLAAIEAGLNAAERGREQHVVSHTIRAPEAPPRPALPLPRKARRARAPRRKAAGETGASDSAE